MLTSHSVSNVVTPKYFSHTMFSLFDVIFIDFQKWKLEMQGKGESEKGKESLALRRFRSLLSTIFEFRVILIYF